MHNRKKKKIQFLEVYKSPKQQATQKVDRHSSETSNALWKPETQPNVYSGENMGLW